MIKTLEELTETELAESKKDTTPLGASDSYSITELSAPTVTTGRLWLHVRVKTKYYVVKQTAEAVAWTTTDKAGKKKKKVGELTLKLKCHGSKKVKKKNASSIKTSQYRFNFPAISKKPAVATGWSSAPSMGPVEVSV